MLPPPCSLTKPPLLSPLFFLPAPILLSAVERKEGQNGGGGDTEGPFPLPPFPSGQLLLFLRYYCYLPLFPGECLPPSSLCPEDTRSRRCHLHLFSCTVTQTAAMKGGGEEFRQLLILRMSFFPAQKQGFCLMNLGSQNMQPCTLMSPRKRRLGPARRQSLMTFCFSSSLLCFPASQEPLVMCSREGEGHCWK